MRVRGLMTSPAMRRHFVRSGKSRKRSMGPFGGHDSILILRPFPGWEWRESKRKENRKMKRMLSTLVLAIGFLAPLAQADTIYYDDGPSVRHHVYRDYYGP